MNSKTIKRGWIAINWINLLSLIVTINLFIYFSQVHQNNPYFIKSSSIMKDNLGSCLWAVGINFLILYFLAYRKPGTRYLSFCLFCEGFVFLKNFYSIAQLTMFYQLLAAKIAADGPLLLFFHLTLSILLLNLLLSPAWTFFSWHLRKLNRKLQLNNIRSIPTYLEAFQNIESAENLDQLSQKYREVSQIHPEIAHLLAITYKESKAKLI